MDFLGPEKKRKLRERSKSVCERKGSFAVERQLPTTNNSVAANEQNMVPKKRIFPGPKSILKQKPLSEKDSSMATIVATNCKLSNTLVDLNRKIIEHQKEHQKMMVLLFVEKKEKWSLQQKLARRDATIKELEQKIKDTEEAKFCQDLISLNNSVPPTNEGKFRNVIVIFLNGINYWN